MHTAAVQMEPIVADIATNVRTVLARVDEAISEGANLIVLPELALSGYVFTGYDETRSSAQEVAASGVFEALAARGAEHDAIVVVGYPELDGDALYNSAAVIGGDGVIGNYRKHHLWNLENEIFTPGDQGYPVFDTHLGTIGVLVCFDIWFPEAARSLALAGADVVCLPTNWVPTPGAEEADRAMATVLSQSTAHVNGIPVIAADRVGVEREQPFIGQSVIASHSGVMVAGPAGYSTQETLHYVHDPVAARAARTWNDYNNPLENRRPDTYVLSDA